MQPVRAAVLALAVALLALVSACGSSGPGYDAQMQAILKPAASKVLKLRVQLGRVGTPQQARTVSARLATLAEQTRSSVAAVKPPGDVAAAHAQLVSAFAVLAGDARTLDAKARGPDVKPFLVAADAFETSPVFAQLAAAIDAIQAKGHDLGLSRTGT